VRLGVRDRIVHQRIVVGDAGVRRGQRRIELRLRVRLREHRCLAVTVGATGRFVPKIVRVSGGDRRPELAKNDEARRAPVERDVVLKIRVGRPRRESVAAASGRRHGLVSAVRCRIAVDQEVIVDLAPRREVRKGVALPARLG